jgi:hypothetical protein
MPPVDTTTQETVEYSRFSVDMERGPGLQLPDSCIPALTSMAVSIIELIKSLGCQALIMGGRCIQLIRHRIPMNYPTAQKDLPTTSHNLSNATSPYTSPSIPNVLLP